MGYYEMRKEVSKRVNNFLQLKEKNPNMDVNDFVVATKSLTGCTNKMIEEFLKDKGLVIIGGELVKNE